MKKIGGNDIWQCWSYRKGFQPVQAMWHETFRMDTRADLMMQLIKIWGSGTAVADAITEAHDQPHKRRENIDDMVMKAAEVVESFWQEGRRRGWIIDIPGFEELQHIDEENI